jgi:hypothetical protein
LHINNRAGLTTPTECAVVWIGRLKVTQTSRRSTHQTSCRQCSSSAWLVAIATFFMVGQPGVADELAKALTGRFKGIVGRRKRTAHRSGR